MVGLNEPCSIVHCSIMKKIIIWHKVAQQVSALSGLAFHDSCTFLLVLFLLQSPYGMFYRLSPLFTCKFRQCQRGLLLSPWHLSPRRFVTRHTCIFDCCVFTSFFHAQRTQEACLLNFRNYWPIYDGKMVHVVMMIYYLPIC